MTSPDGITIEVAERLISLQPRCIECGGTFKCEIHHRVFRSEGELVLQKLLWEMSGYYEKSYSRPMIDLWSIHDIQNLCVLCKECHDNLHKGNGKLRQKYLKSFTDPILGFNVPFYKKNLPF